MESIQIDKESATLIVQIYQQIARLKKILDSKPYSEISTLLESGNKLQDMIDQSMNASSSQLLETELFSIVKHLQKLINYADNNHYIVENKAVVDIFSAISSNISNLQSKINFQK